MANPVFKVIEGPSPTQSGVANASVGGLATVFSAAGKAAEIYPHDRDGLTTFLQFRMRTAEIAADRTRWIGGRIYNWLTGEDTEYVPMSGTHLRQALDAAGIDAPDFVIAAGTYKLRLDIVRNAVNALRTT